VIKTVERKNPSRVPVLTAKWWGEDVTPQFLREAGRRFIRFEEDVAFLWLDMDNAAEWGCPGRSTTPARVIPGW
jgi:hypothetical protein